MAINNTCTFFSFFLFCGFYFKKQFCGNIIRWMRGQNLVETLTIMTVLNLHMKILSELANLGFG